MSQRQRVFVARAVAILVLSVAAAVAAGLAGSDALIVVIAVVGTSAETAFAILPLYRESRERPGR